LLRDVEDREEEGSVSPSKKSERDHRTSEAMRHPDSVPHQRSS
jgi:hypothetical protein